MNQIQKSVTIKENGVQLHCTQNVTSAHRVKKDSKKNEKTSHRIRQF